MSSITISWIEAAVKCRARVVFPEPPFWLMMDRIFIGAIFDGCAHLQACTRASVPHLGSRSNKKFLGEKGGVFLRPSGLEEHCGLPQ